MQKPKHTYTNNIYKQNENIKEGFPITLDN